jgi:hypothetical protein
MTGKSPALFLPSRSKNNATTSKKPKEGKYAYLSVNAFSPRFGMYNTGTRGIANKKTLKKATGLLLCDAQAKAIKTAVTAKPK